MVVVRETSPRDLPRYRGTVNNDFSIQRFETTTARRLTPDPAGCGPSRERLRITTVFQPRALLTGSCDPVTLWILRRRKNLQLFLDLQKPSRPNCHIEPLTGLRHRTRIPTDVSSHLHQSVAAALSDADLKKLLMRARSYNKKIGGYWNAHIPRRSIPTGARRR
jgi:hypothetical protein